MGLTSLETEIFELGLPGFGVSKELNDIPTRKVRDNFASERGCFAARQSPASSCRIETDDASPRVERQDDVLLLFEPPTGLVFNFAAGRGAAKRSPAANLTRKLTNAVNKF